MNARADLIDEPEEEHGTLSDLLPEGTKETLRDIDQRVRFVVSEYPLTAIVGALAAGYLIGRLLR